MSPVRLETEVPEHRRLLCGERPLPFLTPFPSGPKAP